MGNIGRRFGSCAISLAVWAAILCPGRAAGQEDRISWDNVEVRTPTRSYRSISHTAENITVITARQIAEMNAHSVWEILNRVPGVFVSTAQNFGDTSLLHIQGSEEYHVAVFVDGVKWNFLSGGNAETNSIPVDIIEIIEIIKGPASSTWGSSLGGVVNIITKYVGYAHDGPQGAAKTSIGERNTRDHSAWIEAMMGNASLYLFGGRQESDGLRDSRSFENSAFFSKANISITRNAEFNATFGYSEPYLNIGDFESEDFNQKGRERVLFSKADFSYSLPFDMELNLSLHYLRQNLILMTDALGFGRLGQAGELYLDSRYQEETFGGSVNVAWKTAGHTIVAGVDFDNGELGQTLESGPYLQSEGVPAEIYSESDTENRAVYINDTILTGNWAITPGVRYDYNGIVGSFVSPSLGLTYQLGLASILRASISRGFTTPFLTATSGGGVFLDPNPNLDYEKVWSYQAGFESKIMAYLWLKTSLFRHDVDDAIERKLSSSTTNNRFVNSGEKVRQGFELEFETTPIYGLSFFSGFSYTHENPCLDAESKDKSTWTAALKYDDAGSVNAQLYGIYIHHFSDDNMYGSNCDDFIYNLNVNKEIELNNDKLGFFFSVHNIFNGSQYPQTNRKNPDRWSEFGIKYQF